MFGGTASFCYFCANIKKERIEDMENEIVDIPDQGVNGFDFEWEG